MAAQTIPHCPLCGQEINAYIQPALYPGSPEREYGECLNETCRAFGITLLTEDVLLLTPESVLKYPDLRPETFMKP